MVTKWTSVVGMCGRLAELDVSAVFAMKAVFSSRFS